MVWLRASHDVHREDPRGTVTRFDFVHNTRTDVPILAGRIGLADITGPEWPVGFSGTPGAQLVLLSKKRRFLSLGPGRDQSDDPRHL